MYLWCNLSVSPNERNFHFLQEAAAGFVHRVGSAFGFQPNSLISPAPLYISWEKKGFTNLGAQGQEGDSKANLSAQGSNAVVLLIKSQFRFVNTKAFDVSR